MTTETVYTENIASIVSPTAGNIRDLFTEVAGDHADDYDIDKAARKFADCLAEKLAPLGITNVFDSGEARCEVNADIDFHKLYETVTSVDLNDILDSCSIA